MSFAPDSLLLPVVEKTELKHCTSMAKGNASLAEDAGSHGARERGRRSAGTAGKAVHILPWKGARGPESGPPVATEANRKHTRWLSGAEEGVRAEGLTD